MGLLRFQMILTRRIAALFLSAGFILGVAASLTNANAGTPAPTPKPAHLLLDGSENTPTPSPTPTDSPTPSPTATPLERSGACFNFKAKIHPLHAFPKTFPEGSDPAEGEPGHPDWGSVTGVVKKPLAELYKLLLNPRTIRDDEDMKITITQTPSENFLNLYDQALHIKPAFFLTLDWTETWGFSLEEGTKQNPKAILISYEKTAGTSHIRRFCGNYLLRAISPTETGVYLYQELDADRHDYKDILKDLKGTLETLRKDPKKT
jgi:hypothetical protein